MPFKKARSNVRRKVLPTLKKKIRIFFYFIHNTFPYYNTPRDKQVDYKKRKEKTRKTTTYTN